MRAETKLEFCDLLSEKVHHQTTKRSRRTVLLWPLRQALLPGLTLLVDGHGRSGRSGHLNAMLLAPEVIGDIPIFGSGLAGYASATLDVLSRCLLSVADVGTHRSPCDNAADRGEIL